jgi:hypothetical protein
MAKTSSAAPTDENRDENKSFTPVTFHDKAFKSRTLIIGGKSYPVVKSTLVAENAQMLTFLDKRADFERIPEAE